MTNSNKINKFIKNNDISEINILLNKFENKDAISWKDVNDEITLKTWGNAIQKCILEPIDNGYYELQYKDKIIDNINNENEQESNDKDIKENNSDDDENEQESNDKDIKENNSDDDAEDEELPDIDLDTTKWTNTDKALATTTVVSMLGFSIEFIRNIIYTLFDTAFGPMVDILPFYLAVLIFAFSTSVWSTYVREYVIDSSKNDIKKHIKSLRGDKMYSLPDNATSKEEDRLMKLQSALMKEQIKPFPWILSITIPVLVWLYTIASIVGVGDTIIFPILGERTWGGTALLSFQAYIFWYIICSSVSTQIIKRIFILIYD